MLTNRCCAYCERTAEEVAAEIAASRLERIDQEEALRFVMVGNNRVLLCPEDRGGRKPLSEEEMWDLLNSPISLPAGITSIQHKCPLMEMDGFSEEEYTVQLELVPDEEHPGFLYAHCAECGMTVKSQAV